VLQNPWQVKFTEDYALEYIIFVNFRLKKTGFMGLIKAGR